MQNIKETLKNVLAEKSIFLQDINTQLSLTTNQRGRCNEVFTCFLTAIKEHLTIKLFFALNWTTVSSLTYYDKNCVAITYVHFCNGWKTRHFEKIHF